jgi:glutamine synthetase
MMHMSKSSPSKTRLAELGAFLQAHPQVAYVDAIVFDLCGIVRGKRYPRAELEKLFEAGFPFPYSVFLLDVTGATSDAGGRGFSDGDPDGMCVPVPGTLAATPWAGPGAAQVLSTMLDDQGSPATVDPRNLAAAALERFAELRLRPVLAFELEFCLLDANRDDAGRPQAPLSPLTGVRDTTTQVYGMEEVESFTALFDDVQQAAGVQRIPASVATAEYGPGQYEINLQHVDSPLAAADHCALLRHLIKGTARRHGMRATFLSKPFLEQTGNGMHVHMSLTGEDGNNVFDDGSAQGSEQLRHAMGGLLATMGDAMAIFAPNVNAYRRFGPRLYVPVTRSWGMNNRSVALRIPAGSSKARRFEHRVAGADANPYLVLAVLLAGVHHGITEAIDPGPAWQGSACDEMDPDLPFDFTSALARLQSSDLLKSYLGEEYVDLYCETKRIELERFEEHIGVREYDWYL